MLRTFRCTETCSTDIYLCKFLIGGLFLDALSKSLILVQKNQMTGVRKIQFIPTKIMVCRKGIGQKYGYKLNRNELKLHCAEDT